MRKIAEAIIIGLIAAMTFNSDAANAGVCFKVDDKHDPAVTVTGRIIVAPRIKVGNDMRAAEGLYVKLDVPLRVDVGGGCEEWRALPVMGDVRRNRRVTITGKLSRFTSALVKPPIFIKAETIK